MFGLLEKLCIPIRPLNLIKELYRGFEIKIKLKKLKNDIPYYPDVKTHNNLAPILFIIVMEFLAEQLEKKWIESKIYVPKLFYNSNLCNIAGELIRQK